MHHQGAAKGVFFVVNDRKLMLKVVYKGSEPVAVRRLDEEMNVVEHYADGFYLDSITSGKLVQQSQEKDIVLGPVEQDISIQRLEINMMGAAITKNTVIPYSHSLSIVG